jgi:hypothetical protein
MKNAEEMLQNVRVAAPCHESWESMSGTAQVRACERCQHKVYNLSEMTAAEAADVIRKAEGRLCVRFYRRADGTLMTRDCPVGAQARRKKVGRGLAMATATASVVIGARLYANQRPVEATAPPPSQTLPEGTVLLIPTESHTETEAERGHFVLGEVAMPGFEQPADKSALGKHLDEGAALPHTTDPFAH